MNRSTQTLIGAVTALAALSGVAALTVPAEESAGGKPVAERLPVQRSTLVCPQPAVTEFAETQYTAFTPDNRADGKGSAELLPAPEKDAGVPDEDAGKDDKDNSDKDGKDKDGKGKGSEDAVLPLEKPGTPVTATTRRSDFPALYGSANGRFAPGWTVQQSTTVAAGPGRGLQGTACSAPDTDFWFAGPSTAEERQDYVHLTNPDDTAAVVDLELYGKDGAIESEVGEGITVPPHSTAPVLLSTLTSEPVTNVTVHAVVRTGRVAAQVQANDDKLGGDWLPPADVPQPTAVLPGIPEDATAVRLMVHAPGASDADLDVRLATPSGSITPAGLETLHVKAGMTSAVDLDELTQGEAGSLILSPSESGGDTPVVAGVRVTRGKGSKQETAFIPSTGPIEQRATAAANRAKGSTLSLLATGSAAKVRVTASAGSDGGHARSETYRLKAGTTRAVTPPRPEDGKGTYAVTVERISGGKVYAARTLAKEEEGVPMFTVQTLPDDRGAVAVPEAGQDLSVLTE